MERHAILTNGRSGSNLLATTINLHPRLCNYGEVLGPWTVPGRMLRLMSSIGVSTDTYLETIYSSHFVFRAALAISSRSRRRVGLAPHDKRFRELHSIGIKDFFVQMKLRSAHGYFHRHPEIKIIHLHRRNLLQRLLSAENLSRTGQAAMRADAELEWSPPTIDVSTLIARLQVFEAEAADEFANVAAIRPRELLTVVYEQAFRDADSLRATFGEMFEFLGVAPIETPIAHRKMRPRRLTKSIANHDEVVEVLHGTRFECFLDPDFGRSTDLVASGRIQAESPHRRERRDGWSG